MFVTLLGTSRVVKCLPGELMVLVDVLLLVLHVLLDLDGLLLEDLLLRVLIVLPFFVDWGRHVELMGIIRKK